MNFKTTYILFGGLALILVVLGVILYLGPSTTESSKFLLPSVHDKDQHVKEGELDRVDRIEIQRTKPEKQTLRFVRDGSTKRWTVNGYRADSLQVMSLIQALFNADKAKADDPPNNLAEWELSPPNTTITLGRGDQPELKVFLGKVSPGEATAVIYATSSDRPTDAMAVLRSKLDTALKDLVAFRERELIGSDLELVQLGVGKTEGSPAIGIKRTESRSWVYTDPKRFEGAAVESEASTTAEPDKALTSVRGLLDTLANIKVEGEKGDDFVADDVKDLGKYNLGDDNKKLFIVIRRSEEGSKTSDRTIMVGIDPKADDKSDKFYAVIKGENSVVRIPRKSVAALLKLIDAPESLRDKHLVKADGVKTLDAIIIRNAHTAVTKDGKKTERGIRLFRSAPPKLPPQLAGHPNLNLTGSWRMYRGDDKESTAVETGPVSLLESLLTGATVVGFPEPSKTEAELGVSEADEKKDTAVVVEVWLGGLKADENGNPEMKDPTVKLLFGNKGPNQSVAVKRIAKGEANALLYVKSDLFDQVSAKPLTFMSTALPGYVEGGQFGDAVKGVSQLELSHDGKVTWVVTREEGKDDKPWKIKTAETAGLEGRDADKDAVANILRRLNALRAYKIEATEASATDMKGLYELSDDKPQPALKAVVTVLTKADEKPGEKPGDKPEAKTQVKTYTYSFGKKFEREEAGAKKPLQYAKQSQRPDIVFTIEPASVDDLRKDLLDKTVLTLDPSKVKAVKLVGWKSVVTKPLTIEFDSKGNGQWAVKGEPNSRANAEAINGLVDAFIHLKAESFLGYGVPAKDLNAAYGLDTKDDALEITLTIEGKETPIQLTIGKLNGDKGYYAAMPKGKDTFDLFYLKKADFEKAKEKPGNFVQ